MSRKKVTRSDSLDFGDDQISEFKAAFEFFGAEKDQLRKDDLRTIMNKLNLPSNNEVITRMIKEGDPTGSGVVDFTSFVSMMNKKMKKIDNEATLRDAFLVFDPRGTGEINSDDLYNALTTMGDNRLTSAEADQMLEVATKDGKFLYEDFIKEVFGARTGMAQQS